MEERKPETESTDDLTVDKSVLWRLILIGIVFMTAIPFLSGMMMEFFEGTKETNPWIPLIIGVVIGLLALIPLLIAERLPAQKCRAVRNLLWILVLLANSIGTASCLAAYAMHVQMAPTPSLSLLVSALPCGLLLLHGLLFSVIPGERKTISALIVGGLNVVLGITDIVFWIGTDNKLLFSYIWFGLVISMMYMIASIYAVDTAEEKTWLRYTAIGSYGYLSLIALVVMIILIVAGGGDCDGCDCDCPNCSSSGGKNKKSR